MIEGKCKECGKFKKIYPAKKVCYKCNASKKWNTEKKEIVKSLDPDKTYTCLIDNFYVDVKPTNEYGNTLGSSIIGKYLSRKVWKYGKVGDTDAKRSYAYRHKHQYGNLSRHDIEVASKLGNVLDDLAFEKFNAKLKNMNDKERSAYIDKFKSLDDKEFKYSNEANTWTYASNEERQKREKNAK